MRCMGKRVTDRKTVCERERERESIDYPYETCFHTLLLGLYLPSIFRIYAFGYGMMMFTPTRCKRSHRASTSVYACVCMFVEDEPAVINRVYMYVCMYVCMCVCVNCVQHRWYVCIETLRQLTRLSLFFFSNLDHYIMLSQNGALIYPEVLKIVVYVNYSCFTMFTPRARTLIHTHNEITHSWNIIIHTHTHSLSLSAINNSRNIIIHKGTAGGETGWDHERN